MFVLQRLMGNYGLSTLLCISDMAATVSVSRIEIYVHAFNAYLAQKFMVILGNCPL